MQAIRELAEFVYMILGANNNPTLSRYFELISTIWTEMQLYLNKKFKVMFSASLSVVAGLDFTKELECR